MEIATTTSNDRDIVVGWPTAIALLVVAIPWCALVLAAVVVWCMAWALAYASVAALLRVETWRSFQYRAWVMERFGPTPFATTSRMWLNALTFAFWSKFFPSRGEAHTSPTGYRADVPDTRTWVWAGAVGVVVVLSLVVVAFATAHRRAVQFAPAAAKSTAATVSHTSPTSIHATNGVAPVLLGKTLDEAKAFFASEGLPVTVLQEPSYVTPGTVIDQYPAAGQAIAGWGSATLVVTKPFPVIPVLVGKTAGEATSALHDRGFVMSIQRESSSEPAGTVLSQMPWWGNHGWPGQTVFVRVAAP